MNFMNVSIIIVNYKTPALTIDCINSIKKYTRNLEYEIIVVDNNSNDNSKQLITESFSDITYLESKVNLGFGKANNLGVQYSSGDFLFFLNSDTLLLNNSVLILYEFMLSNHNAGASCGNLYKKDLSPNHSYSMLTPTLLSILLYRSKIGMLIPFCKDNFNRTNSYKKVKLIIGADLFVHKEVFNNAGGFDPFYFMYVEDGDLSTSIIRNQYSLYNVPEAKIIHIQGGSGFSLNSLKWEIDGYVHFFKKYQGSYYSRFYLCIELMFIIVKILVFVLTFNRSKIHNYILLERYVINKIISM